MIDKEDEAWYEDQLTLFNHPGWKAFIEHVGVMKASHANILTVKNAEELFKRLGQVDIMIWIEGWEEAVRQQYEQDNVQSQTI